VANHHLYVASGSGTLYAFEGAPVSVTEPDAGTTLPSTLTVEQNFPNPFNAETVIRYSLPEACKVEVEIFNVLGRRVATLVDEEQTAGTHSARWRPQGLGSGLYFYVVSAGEFVATRKLLLLK
jgi:hypothetical protein